MSETNRMRTTNTASMPDVPVFTDRSEKFVAEKHDSLSTFSYAKALGTFIEKCDMPITIGIQGEWGSGKTSLLNMIEVFLKGQEANKKGKKGTRTIKINTWEHSLLRSPEETLLSIIREIIQEISQADDTTDKAATGIGAKALHTLREVGKGAIYSAVTMTAGFKVAERIESAASNIAGHGADSTVTEKNLIKELRQNLRELVETIERDESPTKRFVIFVDDLDRLEP
jgi:ATPase subunit of ABC transporter with duplicated ATPase domains